MSVDPRTLFLISALALGASAGVAALAARAYPPDLRRLGFRWTAGVASLALGWLAIALRGLVSDELSIFAGHGLSLLGFALFLDCFLRLEGRKSPLAWVYLVPIAGVASAAYFFYASPHYGLRVAVFSALNALLSAVSAAVLFRGRRTTPRATARLVASGFAVEALLLGLRALVAARQPATAPTTAILDAGSPDQAILLLVFFCTLGASFAFVVLSNERLNSELQRLATLDSLTGRFNRRTLDELGEREAARSRRHGLDLAVALLDIDSFKGINDHFGHAAGDVALCTVADAIEGELRESDVLGRYGGDELVVLLPATSRAAARSVCERLRRAVAEQPLVLREGRFALTASLGFAVLSGEEVEFDRLLRRADRALYQAKALGRDRVVDGTDPAPEETGPHPVLRSRPA